MNALRTRFLSTKNFCRTKLEDFETLVQSNLSFTPSQMMRMTEKGLPVSPANIDPNLYSDTDYTKDNDFSIADYHERGITMSELWERSQLARKKITNAYTKIRKEFKDANSESNK